MGRQRDIEYEKQADVAEAGSGDFDYLDKSEVDIDIDVGTEAVFGEDTFAFESAGPRPMERDYRHAEIEAPEVRVSDKLGSRGYEAKARPEIELSEELLQRVPEDFEFAEIGRIDLKEAERIANEHILLFAEKDLIEELEDLQDITLRSEEDEGIEEIEEIGEMEPKRDVPEVTIRVERRETVRREEDGMEKAATDVSTDIIDEIGNKRTESRKVEGEGDDVTARQEIIAEEEKEQAADEVISLESIGSEPGKEAEEIPKTQTAEEKGEVHSEVTQAEQEQAPMPDKGPGKVNEPADETASVGLPSDERGAGVDGMGGIQETVTPRAIQKEVLTPALQQVAGSDANVIFIDDAFVEKQETGPRVVLEESRLDIITTDLVEIEVGSGSVMRVADRDEDKERIAPIAKDFTAFQDEYSIDFIDDHKYRDDELEFIHTSIIEEDYSGYLREIDEFQETRGKKGISRAVELFGLTPDESRALEESLFGNEYKNIDLLEIFDFFKDDSVKRGIGQRIEKACTYITADHDSLNQSERESIEEDVSSANALIYEESIEEIRNQLSESAAEKKAESVSVVDTIYDITDKIVILEDEEDIARFIKEFPDDKQSNIKRLLKYLDGLFEKLPETTIKNFANSEYYDLYMKVLNDLEV